MLRVISCLTTQHDWRLVLLAAAVCFLTSFAAINLFHRSCATTGRTRLLWLITTGAATGYGIWATHFIAMLAFTPGRCDRLRPAAHRLVADRGRCHHRSGLGPGGHERGALGGAGRRRSRRSRHRGHALHGYVGVRGPGAHCVVGRSGGHVDRARRRVRGRGALRGRKLQRPPADVDRRPASHSCHRGASLHGHGCRHHHRRSDGRRHGLVAVDQCPVGDHRQRRGRGARHQPGGGFRRQLAPATDREVGGRDRAPARAPRDGAREHVAGTVHVRCRPARGRGQHALRGNVRAEPRAAEARNDAAGDPGGARRQRHLRTHRGEGIRRNRHCQLPREGQRDPAPGRRPVHLRLAPAHARRRPGQHARGHHRAAEGRSPDRASGASRRPDRPAEQGAAARAAGARDRGHAAGRAAPGGPDARPRSVQGGQRHAGSWRRRCAAEDRHATAARLRQRVGYDRPSRRRRVRHRAEIGGPDLRQRRAGEPDPRRRLRAGRYRRAQPGDRNEHRHRHRSR